MRSQYIIVYIVTFFYIILITFLMIALSLLTLSKPKKTYRTLVPCLFAFVVVVVMMMLVSVGDENAFDGDVDDFINVVDGGDDDDEEEKEWSRWVRGLPGDHLLWFGEKIPEPIFTLRRPTPFQF